MSILYSEFFSNFYLHYGLLAIFVFSVPFLITVLDINKRWQLLFPPIKKNTSWEIAIPQEIVPQLTRDGIECPYEYILQVYGRCHFKKLVNILDPTLEARDPGLFIFILELLDSVHFGAILVDDVADNSVLRKGKPAAHHVYGPSETINRAYLRLLEMIDICTKERPSLIPFILDNLTQIHKGNSSPLNLFPRHSKLTRHRTRHFSRVAPRWLPRLPRPGAGLSSLQTECVPKDRCTIQAMWTTGFW